MKQQNPFQKNDELTVEITGITREGQGVGRSSDVAIFVPGAMVGETIKVHIIKVEKRIMRNSFALSGRLYRMHWNASVGFHTSM